MAEKRVQRKLAAILAADVAGYSRLLREDEEGTLAAVKSDIAEAFGLIRHAIASDPKYYGDASEVVEINPLFGF